LVEALTYKPEGRGFDFRWCHWNFLLTRKKERKKIKVLQDMIDKLIEIGRCYGMEMNKEKTKVMRISRQPLPVKIIIEQK
jgi:hypothetical protein